MHIVGVDILFLLSGYLIAKSWQSDPHPLRYLIRRFFRLWPPFAVMILLMAFVAGPLLSDLGSAAYFRSGFQLYLQNLRFFIVYYLPGVFTDVPEAYSVNGSLWTMPVEAALYIVTPLLLTVLCAKRNRKGSFVAMAALTVAMCGFDLALRTVWPNASVVFYATDLVRAYHLAVLYAIGMLFTFEEMRKHLNLQVGCVAMCVLPLTQFSSQAVQYLLFYLIFPYFIFSLAFASEPVFCRFGRRLEPSYGIYLYGFFFQQMVVWWAQRRGIGLSYLAALLLSAAPTLAAAVLSYYLIEMPFQRFSRFLVAKSKRITASGSQERS